MLIPGLCSTDWIGLWLVPLRWYVSLLKILSSAPSQTFCQVSLDSLLVIVYFFLAPERYCEGEVSWPWPSQDLYMFNYNVNNEHFTLEKNDIMRRTISWECIPIIEFAKNKKEYCLIAKYFLSRIQEWLVLWLQCVQWVTHHQKVSTELQGLEAGCILCSEHCITEYQQYY